MSAATDCPLCSHDQGTEIWSDDRLRVIDANEPGWPGFTRVVWHRHVREMTDLNAYDRQHLMQAVWAVEQVMRDHLAPAKINLAQFGNLVPHIHWHVIPRWPEDDRFPDAFWAAPRTLGPADASAWNRLRERVRRAIPSYHQALKVALDGLPP